jgi:hypothetical protein
MLGREGASFLNSCDVTSSWDFVGFQNPAWVDLPLWSEIQAAPYLPKELASFWAAYHRLPKSQATYLLERQQHLGEIAKRLNAESVEGPLHTWVLWLERLASSKSHYLAALQQLLQEGWYEEARLATYLRDFSRLIDPELKPLYLTQDRYLLPDRSVFWGDFWMECLDPCHRQEAYLHKVWQQQKEERPPYLLWLEEFSSSGHERWVRYLTAEAQAETKIQIIEGLLHNARGRALNCAERQHFLFVIDLDQEIYVQRYEPWLCHASFTRGQAVLGAGILQARDGQLTHLKFESGHYLSGPEHWWQAIEVLLRRGLVWGERTRVTVFDRYRYISTHVAPRAVTGRASFFSSLGLSASYFQE